MEFVFDNNDTQHSGRPTMMAGSSTFNTTSRVIDSPRRTRKSVPTSVDQIEITDTRRKRARKKPSSKKVTYAKSVRKKQRKEFNWTWNKVGWLACGLLFLRLIFMETGLIDYYEMERTLEKRGHQLELIKTENRELVTEIHKIKTSPSYQKKLVREHLGVIARNEYLVLFAKDS